MQDYGKIADDVRFPKEFKKKFPKVREVAIECKKRRSLNVHALFAEAKLKYGKNLILASKVPLKGKISFGEKAIKADAQRRYEKATNDRKLDKLHSKAHTKAIKKLRAKRDESIKKRIAQLRARSDISALVTVELGFFRQLWKSWLETDSRYLLTEESDE